MQSFGDLTTTDGTVDTDGDTVLDAEEFARGSDPAVVPGFINQPLSAGSSHTLALRVDSTTLAWGYNSSGQLGDGTTETRPYPVPVIQGGVPVTDVRVVVGGASHSLALTGDGRALAWGNNQFGQLGDGTTTTQLEPVWVTDGSGAPLTGLIALAADTYHSLALRADGTVWTWGYNNDGQLGDGTTTNRSRAVLLTDGGGAVITDVVAVAAGQYFSLALKRDGHVLAWGDNSQGQLGDGTLVDRLRPVAVLDTTTLPLTGVEAIAAGVLHSMALTTTGQVLAWGYNAQGQLGDGTTTNRSYPGLVEAADGNALTGITAIAAGNLHNLALSDDTGVWAWGYNTSGQLGDGTTTRREQAVRVLESGGGELTDVVALTGGGNHSLALLADGTLRAWGSNISGQLSDGTTSNSAFPVIVVNEIGEVVLFSTSVGLDTDRDGVPDAMDVFPLDPNESIDTDSDGIGNNADTDDDNDDLSDFDEGLYGTYPLLSDTDLDGFTDGEEVTAGTNPLDDTSYPIAAAGDVNGDGEVDVRDLLLAMQILNGQYIPTQEEQDRWDVAPLVNGVPEPDGQNNLGDYLILQRKVLGIINF